MSPVVAPSTALPPSTHLEKLTALANAPSNVEAKSIADGIALELKKAPRTLDALQDARIVDVVLAWAASKSGYERESAVVLVERICRSLGSGIEGVFLPLIPAILNLAMDKGQPVRSAVNSAMTSLIKATAPDGARKVFEVLTKVLEETKGWRTKIAALKAMEGLVKPGAEDYVANELGTVIPVVEHAMHDTKAEVSIISFIDADIRLSLVRSLPPLKKLPPLFVVSFPTLMCSSMLTSSFLPWLPLPQFPPPSKVFLPPLSSLKSTVPLLPSWSPF